MALLPIFITNTMYEIFISTHLTDTQNSTVAHKKVPRYFFYKVTEDFSLFISVNNQTTIYSASSVLLAVNSRLGSRQPCDRHPER